ncbi:hypothetical protein V7S43_000716 [Phytophthora oleae]|uniref:RxLR effector protein n=1 Tax=Phytophthora oleae TaxID=2107226 RepID=A0ABD3G6J0_9STRA
MRVSSVVLLIVATTLAASASAQSESKQNVDITSPAAPQWRAITENQVFTKRNLRKESESKDERSITSAVSSVDELLKLKGLVPFAEIGGLSAAAKAKYLKVLVTLPRQDIINITGKVPYWVRKYPDSWKGRIMQYNSWIWTNKQPEWVMENFPGFFKGYDLFFNNRMTRGYKYA